MFFVRTVITVIKWPTICSLLACFVIACGDGGGSPPAPKSWGTATLIETDDSGDAWIPNVAVDANGNAIAVWEQSDGIRNNIWANRYDAATGWGTATLIETDDSGNAWVPNVAVDANGNAIAVWEQSDGNRNNIWANRYDAVTGWGTATLIETDDTADAWFPKVAVDANGNAIAVWSQHGATRFSIWANRYDAVTGWGTATLIETDDTGDAWNPSVAVDANGNALAVWSQHDATRYNIWANRYDAVTGWGTATLIETDDSGNAEHPRVDVDASGNAIAVWYQSDGIRNNIWANRYDAVTGWGTATLIETDDSGNAEEHPRVDVDASGNALAVWSQSDGTRYNIWANRYDAVTGWGTATLIETDDTGDAWLPNVAVDANGNALAVWSQYDATRLNIWANRYDAVTGWGTATRIESDDSGNAVDPNVAVDANGNAITIWRQFDGTRYNIWANRYE